MPDEMDSRVLNPYPIAEDLPLAITKNFHQWVVKSGTFQTILVNTVNSLQDGHLWDRH